jgi:hypothetical protein
VYHLDEFRTSKLHHETEEECGNLKMKFKKKLSNKTHNIKKQSQKINKNVNINKR